MNSLDWVTLLLEWYKKNMRMLPWRSIPDPYRTWVSEIMLQQTQVETVIPYFCRFMDCFPTITSLAEADIQDVLKLWEGLGYYSRAQNLHHAASVISRELKGRLPSSYDELRRLPGIGDYTAGAIASIAFGQATPALDGNALRVFARFWGIVEPIEKSSVKKLIHNRLLPIIRTTIPSLFNQSVMELGALICRPRKPDCQICPVKDNCIAKRKNLTSKLPIKKKGRTIPSHLYGAGIIWAEDRILIQRRRYNTMLGGLWEFPGGRLDVSFNLGNALSQKILDKTSLKVRVLGQYGKVKHAYSHFKIMLLAYKCELVRNKSESLCTTEMSGDAKWLKLEEVSNFPLDKATLKILALIKQTKECSVHS